MIKQFKINKEDGYVFDKVMKDGTYNLNGEIVRLEKGDSVHVVVKKGGDDEKKN